MKITLVALLAAQTIFGAEAAEPTACTQAGDQCWGRLQVGGSNLHYYSSFPLGPGTVQPRAVLIAVSCLNVGLRAVPRERRASRDESLRILASLEAIAAAARAGLDEHDRLVLAQAGFARRCRNLRSNARLPALAELALATPLITAPMIAQSLRISARAAQDLAPALGLRELTGRGRFRAWGV